MTTTNTPLVDCDGFGQELARYLADDLSGEPLKLFRGHLSACASCRLMAERREPSLIFARLAAVAGDEGSTERSASRAGGDPAAFLESVRRGIAIKEAEKTTARARRRSGLLRLAAAFAMVAVGGVVAFRVTSKSAAPIVAIHRAEIAPAATPALSLPEPVRLASKTPAIEDLDRRDARVYDLNPGSDQDDPHVVLIVDGGMDI